MVTPEPAASRMPVASRKRKAAESVDECASKKPKLVKEVIVPRTLREPKGCAARLAGQSVAKRIVAKPDPLKPSVLEKMMARFQTPARKPQKAGLQTPTEPPKARGARKVCDKTDANVVDQNDKAEVKVKARPEERATRSSMKRKDEGTLRRPAKK